MRTPFCALAALVAVVSFPFVAAAVVIIAAALCATAVIFAPLAVYKTLMAVFDEDITGGRDEDS